MSNYIVRVSSTVYNVSVDTDDVVIISASGAIAASGTVTSITPAADNGSGTPITTSGTLTVTGGTSIDTSVSGTNVTVNLGNLSADLVTSGTLGVARIPDLTLSKITDAGTAAAADTGTGSSNVILGNDSRLTDARTPVAHSADLVTSGTLGVARIPDLTLSKITDAGTAAAADTGTGSSNVILGNDSRLTDARTPTSHNHSASEITSGTLAIARGGTGSATAPMVGLITAADAAAARTVLGVGTGTGDMVGANNLSELTNTATARSNLGVPATNHNHSTANITSGTFADARIASSNVTQHADQIALTDLSNVQSSGGILGDGVAPYYDTTSGKYVIGNLAASAVPLLAANKISSGTFAVARIPDLTLSKITDSGGAAALDVGTTSGTVCAGDDSRLSDARTPTSHNHAASEITSGTLAVARGGTGSATAPMVGVITAADAAAARTVLGAGTGTLSNVSEDTTPQLGGNLDVNGNSIVSASAGNISITPDGAGKVILDGLSWPTSDGSANQVLKTDGSGNLSFVTTSAAGASDDYVSKPITASWKYFDDMFQLTPDSGSVDGNNQFWMMQGGSGITPGEAIYSDARGVVQLTMSGDNRRHTYWGGMILNGVNEADGDELLWEARLHFVDSTATSGSVRVGVVDRINTLNKGDASPSQGYSGFDFAALVVDLAETNLVIAHKDTGSAGNPTSVDLGSSFPVSSYVDTFIRLGVHAKYNNTDSDWDIDFYVNGTKVGSTVSITFDDALVPYIGCGVGTHSGNCNMNLDWISYQGNIGSQISGRTTLISIGDI